MKCLTKCLEAHLFPRSNLSPRESCVVKLHASQTTLEVPGPFNFGSKPDRVVSCQPDSSDNLSFYQPIVHVQLCLSCSLLVTRRDVAPASSINPVNKRLGQDATSAPDKPYIQLRGADHPNLHPLSPWVIV